MYSQSRSSDTPFQRAQTPSCSSFPWSPASTSSSTGGWVSQTVSQFTGGMTRGKKPPAFTLVPLPPAKPPKVFDSVNRQSFLKRTDSPTSSIRPQFGASGTGYSFRRSAEGFRPTRILHPSHTPFEITHSENVISGKRIASQWGSPAVSLFEGLLDSSPTAASHGRQAASRWTSAIMPDLLEDATAGAINRDVIKKRSKEKLVDGIHTAINVKSRKRRNKKRLKRKNLPLDEDGPLLSTTPYPLFPLPGTNWIFQSTATRPQVSTLETSFSIKSTLHDTSYIRRLTTETDTERHLMSVHQISPGSHVPETATNPTVYPPHTGLLEHLSRRTVEDTHREILVESELNRPSAKGLMSGSTAMHTRPPMPRPPWQVTNRRFASSMVQRSSPTHIFNCTSPEVQPAPSWTGPSPRFFSPQNAASVVTRYNVAKVFSFVPFCHTPVTPQALDNLIQAVPTAKSEDVNAISPPTSSMSSVSPPSLLSHKSPSADAKCNIPEPELHWTTQVPPRSLSERPPEEATSLPPTRSGRQVIEDIAPIIVKAPSTRSVSVSITNDSSPLRKGAGRRVKNRSLQFQSDIPKALTSPDKLSTTNFTSPQRVSKVPPWAPCTKSFEPHISAVRTAELPLKIGCLSEAFEPPTIASIPVKAKVAPRAILKMASDDVESAHKEQVTVATPEEKHPAEWPSLNEVTTDASPISTTPSPSLKVSHDSMQRLGSPPGFAEFILGLLSAEKLNVEFCRSSEDKLAMSLFQGALESVVNERENEFVAALESEWLVQSDELAAASKLFSQATLSQVADVQTSDWFLDDAGKPMKIQSQLLPHMYHTLQPRNVFDNYFSFEVQGLDKSLDLPKYLDTRRIQNSVRKYLEYSLEAFLTDICLGIKHGCQSPSSWTSDSTEIKTWVEAARCLTTELLKRPTQLISYLRSQFAFVKEKAGRGLPEDQCVPNAISGEQLDAVLTDLSWWPLELNLEDRREILEAISLATSKAQHAFASQVRCPLSFDPHRPIFEEDYVSVLACVPLNLPDFMLEAAPKNFNELAANDQLDELLREVVRVARNIANTILNVAHDDLAESGLAKYRIPLSLRQKEPFRINDCLRSRSFIAQDFLASYATSIEELQMMALDYPPVYSAPPSSTRSGDSLPPSRSSDSVSLAEEPGLMTPLEIAEDIIRAARTNSMDVFRLNEEVLPCLHIVQLAVEYMVGLSIHAMSNSERFSVRAPFSTLATRIDTEVVVKQFFKEPPPLPPNGCLPHQVDASDTSKALNPFTSTTSSLDFFNPAELVELTRVYERNGRSQFSTDTNSSCPEKEEQDGSCAPWSAPYGCHTHGQTLKLACDTLPVFVVLHSLESLKEIQRLFIATETQSSKAEIPNPITLKHESLKSGDPETWSKFWAQSGEPSSSLSSHVQGGSWGPVRWNSLRKIASIFHELQIKRHSEK